MNSIFIRMARLLPKRVRWYIPPIGVRSKNINYIMQYRPVRLLVLCHGNIYRSPFVEEVIKCVARDVQVRSAGFFPKSGRKSEEDFIRLASEYGIDLRDHRSQLVDTALVAWADAIVIMDGKNWEMLSSFGKSVLDKTVWLGAFLVDDSIAIPDPYGKDLAEVRWIADKLFEAATNLGGLIQSSTAPR